MALLLTGTLALAATLALARTSESVDLLRFPLSWWAVVLALRGAVTLREKMAPDIREIAWLSAGSVVFWDIFELFDLRLHDWWYVGLPRSAAAGASFSAVSFATVLPAARLSFLLIAPRDSGPAGLSTPVQGLPLDRVLGIQLIALGIFLPLLILLFPGVAYPLTWVFPWLLCEGALCLLPRTAAAELTSPLEALRARARPLFLRWCCAALALGLLWEALNDGCARGWVYTVPGIEGAKVFQMPVLGYLGYVPFFLGAVAVAALLLRVAPRLLPRRSTLLALGAAAAMLHCGVDGLGRRESGISLAGKLADSRDLERSDLEALERAGIGTPRALLDALSREGVEGLSRRSGVSPSSLDHARALASLAQVAHLGVPWAERLLAAGVKSPAALAQADELALAGRLAAAEAARLRPGPRGGPAAGGDTGDGAPAPALLRLWIRAAQSGKR